MTEPTPPKPTPPKPGPPPGKVPTPAAVAASHPRPEAPAAPHPPSDSARFGRVDEDGRVFVRDGESEREVGSYPGAGPDEALQYFARKYDELFASAELLHQRVASPDVPSKEVAEGLRTLRGHADGANVVGDLDALRSLIDAIDSELTGKREQEAVERAAAKEAARAERERIVLAAEEIAAQPEQSIQWKSSSARMRSLLEEWKAHQRSAARLDKPVESELWRRFSRARNSFDKARRSHFAHLEGARAEAKATKEDLVAEAEELSTSTDWGATAGAFKRLMDRWRAAGRANRADDDALWQRFKTAQDAFFAAKDALADEEDRQFRANLEVKEALLAEAEQILPITDLDAAKAQLRSIQERWEHAGKVPRGDIDRTEKGLRRIESAVRGADDDRWAHRNPEVAARAQSMVTQLETSVSSLREDLEEAERSGDERRVAEARDKLAAQEQWLQQARAGLDEFGG